MCSTFKLRDSPFNPGKDCSPVLTPSEHICSSTSHLSSHIHDLHSLLSTSSPAHITDEPARISAPMNQFGLVHVTIRDLDHLALIDSGSCCTLISQATFNKINYDQTIPISDSSTVTRLKVANNTFIEHPKTCLLDIQIENQPLTIRCYIAHPLCQSIIIGRDTLLKHNFELNFKDNLICFDNKQKLLTIAETQLSPGQSTSVPVCFPQLMSLDGCFTAIADTHPDSRFNSHLPLRQELQIVNGEAQLQMHNHSSAIIDIPQQSLVASIMPAQLNIKRVSIESLISIEPYFQKPQKHSDAEYAEHIDQYMASLDTPALSSAQRQELRNMFWRHRQVWYLVDSDLGESRITTKLLFRSSQGQQRGKSIISILWKNKHIPSLSKTSQKMVL